jgi:hypothetical protein
MARAKRHFIPGYVWHITHRCHKREFLLKLPRDRRRWIEWLYQAKKRYSGLSVLNYDEIQNPRKRKGIIDFDRLMDLLGFDNYDDLKDAHPRWVDSEMQTDDLFELRDSITLFGNADNLDSANTFLWNQHHHL